MSHNIKAVQKILDDMLTQSVCNDESAKRFLHHIPNLPAWFDITKHLCSVQQYLQVRLSMYPIVQSTQTHTSSISNNIYRHDDLHITHYLVPADISMGIQKHWDNINDKYLGDLMAKGVRYHEPDSQMRTLQLEGDVA